MKTLPDHINDDELTALVENIDNFIERDIDALTTLSAQYRAVTDAMGAFNIDDDSPLEEDPLYCDLLDVRTKLYELRRAFTQVSERLDELQQLDAKLSEED